MTEKAVRPSIDCSWILGRVGREHYETMQKGLEATGWKYDIQSDCWVAPEEPDVAECEPAQDTTFNFAQVPNYPVDFPSEQNVDIEAERRRYHIQQCVMILKQALLIRQDSTLMAEIAAYIRDEKNQLMNLLDEIHG